MSTKQILLLVTILFLLAGCGRGGEVVTPESSLEAETAVADATATPLATVPVQSGTTILADGELVAVSPALPLSFTTSGRLLEIHVTPGDRVTAGDLIATLDDEALRAAVTSAELQVTKAENSLAQAQLSLDDLLDWEPDELAVAVAEANLAAAEADYENAQSQDATAGNNLTVARVEVEQAERGLADAQEAYDTAWDPGRDWELNIRGRKEALENEREAATRALQQAEDRLEVAQANYNLAAGGLNNDAALAAEAAVVNAQQTLDQATSGPEASEIAAARLQVEQAQLSLEEARFNLAQAQSDLEEAQLRAPWAGTVLSVETAPGTIVSSGTSIVTLVDTQHLQFHTSNLSERDLAPVAPGQAAEITFKTYPGRPLSGTVARIEPQAAGTVGDAATFTVVIDLPQTDLMLLAGMTGRVEIRREAE